MVSNLGIIGSVLAFAVILFCSPVSSLAKESLPHLNNGQKWRIAYYQGGPIPFYSNIFKEILNDLMQRGWIDAAELPEQGLGAEPPFWDWLCNTATSKYLEFLPVNGYSASWDEAKRGNVRKELLARLQAGEIDLVIAMGTWAGEDLVNSSHSTPTIVMSAANFEKTGIIKSLEDSGFDHVNVMLDPTFTERQLRMYHRLTGFEKLGVAYENTEEGLIYSYVDVIDVVATERGFTVNHCAVLDTTEDRQKARASCLSCFQELAANSDAIFITSLLCADEEIEALSTLFKEKEVFSYSLFGSMHVAKGILLGASAEAGYAFYGAHSGKIINEVLGGTKPRAIPQLTELPFSLSFNDTTAKALNFRVPESIRRIAHGIYEK